MSQFTTLTSGLVSLPLDDIDTDQIIPARFLKTTKREGLGEHLFADWRQEPEFVLNGAEPERAQILLAGNNFGCGSSREHAPWALLDWGFRVVIARSFGDIFKNNALKCGLLPVVVNAETWSWLKQEHADNPALQVTVDLRRWEVDCPNSLNEPLVESEIMPVRFEIDAFARHCLLKGSDQLSYLLSFSEQVSAYETRHLAS